MDPRTAHVVAMLMIDYLWGEIAADERVMDVLESQVFSFHLPDDLYNRMMYQRRLLGNDRQSWHRAIRVLKRLL